MSWTQTDLDNINKAISTGALVVKHGEQWVTYRSVDEMLRIRNMMIETLSPPTTSTADSRRVYPTFSKGL